VWSAAASFGDEAYSTAMLLADLQQRRAHGQRLVVLATDISDRVLRSAKEAVYPEDRLRAVSPERLRRYCLRGSGDEGGRQDKIRRVQIWASLCCRSTASARLM
jgi:chemotaxis protein methyltransferase CheR